MHHCTGEVIPLARLSIPRLRTAIEQVLTEESYLSNALRLKQAIRGAGGVKRAADIVEQAVKYKHSTPSPLTSSVSS